MIMDVCNRHHWTVSQFLNFPEIEQDLWIAYELNRLDSANEFASKLKGKDVFQVIVESLFYLVRDVI